MSAIPAEIARGSRVPRDLPERDPDSVLSQFFRALPILSRKFDSWKIENALQVAKGGTPNAS